MIVTDVCLHLVLVENCPTEMNQQDSCKHGMFEIVGWCVFVWLILQLI